MSAMWTVVDRGRAEGEGWLWDVVEPLRRMTTFARFRFARVQTLWVDLSVPEYLDRGRADRVAPDGNPGQLSRPSETKEVLCSVNTALLLFGVPQMGKGGGGR